MVLEGVGGGRKALEGGGDTAAPVAARVAGVEEDTIGRGGEDVAGLFGDEGGGSGHGGTSVFGGADCEGRMSGVDRTKGCGLRLMC